MFQQIADRCMHNVRDGEGVNPHCKNTHGKNKKKNELSIIDVLQFSNMIVSNSAKNNALVHPQRVRRPKYQRRRRSKTYPKVVLNRTQCNHKFPYKPRGCWKSGIRHRKQHEQRCKLGHHVHNATIISNLARMHSVVQHANTRKHRTGNKSMRDHLDERTFDAEKKKYRTVWLNVDNLFQFHETGTLDDAGKVLTLISEHKRPDGTVARTRSVFTKVDDTHITCEDHRLNDKDDPVKKTFGFALTRQ